MNDSATTAGNQIELDAAFQGEQFRPGDNGYDEARAVYNGMVDKRPALVARCSGCHDVMIRVATTGSTMYLDMRGTVSLKFALPATQ